MKLEPIRGRLIAAMLLALGATATLAAGLIFDWPGGVVAGGGGTSAGGPYALTATIGQSATGRMSGGPYALEGGFLAAGAAPPTRNAARAPWWLYENE